MKQFFTTVILGSVLILSCSENYLEETSKEEKSPTTFPSNVQSFERRNDGDTSIIGKKKLSHLEANQTVIFSQPKMITVISFANAFFLNQDGQWEEISQAGNIFVYGLKTSLDGWLIYAENEELSYFDW